MTNPYAAKPPQHFWKLAVGEQPVDGVRPVPANHFRLKATDVIATAGSCFAQHVSAHLKARELVRLLETESAEAGQPVFSARYGNIYTARQLVQLMEEALGGRRPANIAWKRADGTYVDALRPSMFPKGLADPIAVEQARTPHRTAVRALLTECTVFIFTLGLTEAWRSRRDDTVYPLAPGVMAEPVEPTEFEFHNFTYEEVSGDLEQFVTTMKEINPGIRIILTVSPVPLTATFGDEHVLVATTHSKAILRAVCSAITSRHPEVYYFPSYEIITGNFTRGCYFEENLRTISQEGVAHVMRVFDETYGLAPRPDVTEPQSVPTKPQTLFSEKVASVICDEPEIVKSIGF